MGRSKASYLKGVLAGVSVGVALLLRGVSRAPLTPDISSPLLATTLPSAGWLLLTSAVGATAGAMAVRWLEGRGAVDVTHPLMLPGVALLAYVPGAVRAVPFLSALTGPLLDLLLLGSFLAATGKLLARTRERIPVTANRTALLVFLLLVTVGLRLQATTGLSGDEPHYLLVTQSLLEDGDLKVANNYARGDFESFYRGKIGPHLARGTEYSIHGVGLPLLLFPGFALGGLLGVLLTEAAIGALVAREIFRATELLTQSIGAALLATSGFVLTAPALFLCVSAYPELPAALVGIAVFRRLLDPVPPGRYGALGWGVLLGLLPLLHMKFFPLSAVLGLILAARWRSEGRHRLAVGLCLGLVTVPSFYLMTTGDPNPLSAYGRQRIFLGAIPRGLAGLFFDQEFGLLPVSPFYLLGIAGIAAMHKRGWLEAAAPLLALAAVAIPGAAHPLWSGGSSPPARFLFPALPLLATCAGAAWAFAPRFGVVRWTGVCWLVSFCLGAFMLLGPDQPLYLNQRDGSGRVWEALGTSWDLTHYLPSIVRNDSRSMEMAVMGFGLTLLAGVSLLRSRFPVWPPALLSAVLILTAVDHGAPGAPPPSSEPRFMEALLTGLASHEGVTWVSLPAMTPLDRARLLEAIRLPLTPYGTTRAAGADGHRWTRSVRVPAGRFMLAGRSGAPVTLCNGEGCFAETRLGRRFETRVSLEDFHVRASREAGDITLEPLELFPSGPRARASVGSAARLWLHRLDENAVVEPTGIWIRARRSARIAIEGRCADCRLVLANGSNPNWVEIAGIGVPRSFSVRPDETKTLELQVDGVLVLTVESRSGFRPAEREPEANDRRQLGVFLTVEGADAGSPRDE